MGSNLELKTQDEARAWIRAQAALIKRPAVVLLSGPLGAGKTQFVRWFLHELKVEDVASPTFAIHHSYPAPSGPIDHVDLYRLKDDRDLEASGFWDLFAQAQGLVFVEWAERLPSDVWPKDWQQLHIALSVEGSSGVRRLTYEMSSKKP
jgi:tRNA threonylcarbamoyladenosine biosynthesis protein TsaE